MASNYINASFRNAHPKKDYYDDDLDYRKPFLSRTLVEREYHFLLYTLPSNTQNFYTKIKESSDEFMKIIKLIKKSGCDINKITIYSVEKLNNPYLSALYELKKLEMKRVNKNVKELKLFHGTTKRNANLISKENFDYRLCGMSRGVKYGQGVSFSPYFLYAKCFCNKQPDARKTIFLCDVLYFRSHIGNKEMEVPDPGYDTTVRDKKEVYVKYDDDTFIPRYRITFDLK